MYLCIVGKKIIVFYYNANTVASTNKLIKQSVVRKTKTESLYFYSVVNVVKHNTQNMKSNEKKDYLSPHCETVILEADATFVSASDETVITSSDIENPEDDGEWFWD